MEGFCSLNVYEPQDCVVKAPQKESVVDFHEEKVFQMKMCYKHRATLFASLQPGINNPFALSPPSKQIELIFQLN